MPTGIYIRTEEHLAQIRSIVGSNKGKRFSKEWRKNLSKAHKGYVMSEEMKEKLRISHLARGSRPPTAGLKGKDSPSWKGDDIGYFALHTWVKRNLGKPSQCINGCIAKRYVWANISGEYKRDLSDWHESCDSCNFSDGVKIAIRFLKGGYQNSNFN